MSLTWHNKHYTPDEQECHAYIFSMNNHEEMRNKGEDYIKFKKKFNLTPWSSKINSPNMMTLTMQKYISKLQYDPLLETPKKKKKAHTNLQKDTERITPKQNKNVHETGICHSLHTQTPPQPHTCKHASSTWSKGCKVGQASSASLGPPTQSQVHVKIGSALRPSPQLVSIFYVC